MASRRGVYHQPSYTSSAKLDGHLILIVRGLAIQRDGLQYAGAPCKGWFRRGSRTRRGSSCRPDGSPPGRPRPRRCAAPISFSFSMMLHRAVALRRSGLLGHALLEVDRRCSSGSSGASSGVLHIRHRSLGGSFHGSSRSAPSWRDVPQVAIHGVGALLGYRYVQIRAPRRNRSLLPGS